MENKEVRTMGCARKIGFVNSVSKSGRNSSRPGRHRKKIAGDSVEGPSHENSTRKLDSSDADFTRLAVGAQQSFTTINSQTVLSEELNDESNDGYTDATRSLNAAQRNPMPSIPPAEQSCSRYHLDNKNLNTILIPGDPVLFNWKCEVCTSHLIDEDGDPQQKTEFSKWLDDIGIFLQ